MKYKEQKQKFKPVFKLKINSPNIKPGQEEYWEAIQNYSIIIVTGFAGTGKSYIALREGLKQVLEGNYKKIVIVRSYMPSNTGEKIGSLPGELSEKILPYVGSVRDSLEEFIQNKQDIDNIIEQYFEFTALSTCRGRSFNDSWILVEEAQNCTIAGDSLKMLFTRLGKGSKLILAGDLDQLDIPEENSGLIEAINIVQDIPEIAIIEMNNIEAIQRHPLIKKILIKFEQFRNKNRKF